MLYSSLFILSAAVAGVSAQASPAPTIIVTAPAGSVALGQQCSTNEQCAGGASCFASTNMGIKTCGSFNAACTTDAQCATNTCQNGICSGFKSSTTSAPATKPTGSVKLGEECQSTEECAGGASCFGTTSGTIKTCGSFNAACKSDDQCATNTCQNGICSGFKSTTSSAPASKPTGSVKLGGECQSTEECAGGASCFGTTSGTIKTCGSFNAACKSDDQCATNTCQNGICSGFKSTTSAAAATSTAAPVGTLQLGAECQSTEQCANGASCFGTTAGTIKTCGSFNAACKSDSQCATNTCQNGICSGPKLTTITTDCTTTSNGKVTQVRTTVTSVWTNQPSSVPAAATTTKVPAASTTGAKPSVQTFAGAAGKLELTGGAAIAAAVVAFAL